MKKRLIAGFLACAFAAGGVVTVFADVTYGDSVEQEAITTRGPSVDVADNTGPPRDKDKGGGGGEPSTSSNL